jgi:hypothetical protein
VWSGGGGKEEGKLREEENKMLMVCQVQSMQTDMDSSLRIHFIKQVRRTHEN